MSTSYPIPPFFRLLIIDDRVAANPEHREFLCNVFTAMAMEEASGKKCRLAGIEVVFESDPARGFRKWQDEPFNITLIDVDFTSNLEGKSAKDADDLTRYILNSRDQGVQIFKLIEAQIGENGAFYYRKDICRFFFWTGLPDKDEKDEDKIIPGLNSILQSHNSKRDDIKILKKDDNCLSQLKGEISEQIQAILKDCKDEDSGSENRNKFSAERRIERLLFALRNNYDNISDRLFGGCLIFDEEDKFDFLSEIAKVKDKSVRVCPGRIPPVLLKDSNKTRFLPLHRKIIEGNLRDSIRFLLAKEGNKISGYCSQLAKRDELVNKSDKHLPFFPDSEPNDKNKRKLLGLPVKNQFIASATPLTGISVIGEKNAREALKRKVKALLAGPFGAVVLKTAYLDDPKQWENIFWPGLQIQSHMRTRCLYPDTGSPTLWNTGCTAVEMLPPNSLNEFLLDISQEEWLENQTHRIIVSMGSKFPRSDSLLRKREDKLEFLIRRNWQRFFEQVFRNFLFNDKFPLIEINVRHYLREIIEYYLGGDEYLNPIGFDQKNNPDIHGFWHEFQVWLRVIHDLGIEYKKRIILKFPYRSDVLSYIQCAVGLREFHIAACKEDERDYGIRGLTLVNALKSPVPTAGMDNEKSGSSISNIPFTPDWYANPDAWSDAQDKKFKYQMSGRFIGPYRNQILAGISSELNRIKSLGMEIFVSGGITSKKDIEFIQALSKQHYDVISGIQIGTWGLLNTELGDKKKSWMNVSEPPIPAKPDYLRFSLDVDSCAKICCDVTLCPHGALGEKRKGEKAFFVNKELCDTCTTYDCDGKCKKDIVKLKLVEEKPERPRTSITRSDTSYADKNIILPRISFLNEKICKACGTCSHTFYCDSFIDRANDKLPPLMDSRNCSGCGLCVQVCSSGALQLYKPEEMLILISESEERRDILRKLSIPFLAYDPEDISNFSILESDIFENFRAQNRESITEDDLNQLWDYRLEKDNYLPGSGERDLREERRETCIYTAKELINQLKKETIKESRTVLLRAIVWSQLIWSDPGQIFWDSFIMTVRSYFCRDGGQYIGQMKMEDLSTQYQKIKIANYMVLLRRGEVVYRGVIESNRFSISGIDKAMLEKYKEAGFNKDRLGGLDLRTSSGFLVKDDEAEKNFHSDHSELLACAGMPWQKLAQKMEKHADRETREAFDRLKNAVARRTYN